MTQTLYLLMSIVVGIGSATQLAMLGAMGRERGAYEATFISITGTIAGLSIVVLARLLRSEAPNLPAPLDSAWPWALIIMLCAIAMSVAIRGLPAYFAVCGLFATAYLLSVGFAGPKLGIALFLGASTAGTLFGSAVYDHIGAFGTPVHEATALRAAGIAVIFAGVVIVRVAP